MAEPNGKSDPVRVRGLSKRYGERWALRSVSFVAHRGELVAVIGPNGAGKTTLLATLAGLIKPDGGEVSVVPESVGWVPQHHAVYHKLTVRENLRLFARLEGVDDVERSVERMLRQTGLEQRADGAVDQLSGGNIQRVNIAIGLLGDPQLLLLDEPTSALDPRQRELTWRFIEGLCGGGTTVVFATHNVQEAEHYGDQVLVIADGEDIFAGTPTQMREAVAAEEHIDRAGRMDFEHAFIAFLRSRGH